MTTRPSGWQLHSRSAFNAPKNAPKKGGQPLASLSATHPECEDCRAFLQEVRIPPGTFLRCPWATDDRFRTDGHHIPVRIYCVWPRSGKTL